MLHGTNQLFIQPCPPPPPPAPAPVLCHVLLHGMQESCSIYDAETTVDRLYSSRTSHTAYGTKTAVDRVFSPPLLETKPLAGLDSAGSSPLDVSQLPSSDVAKDALEAGALWSPVMERGQTPEAEQTCPDNQPSAVSLEAETIDMDEFQVCITHSATMASYMCESGPQMFSCQQLLFGEQQDMRHLSLEPSGAWQPGIIGVCLLGIMSSRAHVSGRLSKTAPAVDMAVGV